MVKLYRLVLVLAFYCSRWVIIPKYLPNQKSSIQNDFSLMQDPIPILMNMCRLVPARGIALVNCFLFLILLSYYKLLFFVGQRFALLEIRTVLAKLVRHFEILPPKTPFEPMLAATATTMSNNGVYIRVKRRI